MQTVEPLLGTRAEVAVTAVSADVAEAGERAILDEAARLEAVFTVFDESSELHTLRRTGTTEVAELATVAELAHRWRLRTGGAFHPGVQPLVDLWDRAAVNGAVPAQKDLLDVVAMLGSDSGPTNPNTNTNPNINLNVSLNLNGIAKGWIAERAVRSVVDEVSGVSAAWLSLGGDVVHRGEGSVMVGIEDPRRPYDNVAPLMQTELSGEALATSGGSRRWWTIGTERYSKVLDPRSGQPGDRVVSATVVAPDGATADVLATVALILAPEETLALVDEADAACLLIDGDGVITSSSDRFRPSSTR